VVGLCVVCARPDCNDDRCEWAAWPAEPDSRASRENPGDVTNSDVVDIHDLTELLIAVGRHAAHCAWAEVNDNGGAPPDVPNALAWDMLGGAIGLAIAGDPAQDDSERAMLVSTGERAIFEGAYKAELARLPALPTRDDVPNRYTIDLTTKLARYGREAANDAWVAHKGEPKRIPNYPELDAWRRLGAGLRLLENDRVLSAEEQRVFVDAYRAELKALAISAESWKRGGR
jgi:hypothetical protein